MPSRIHRRLRGSIIGVALALAASSGFARSQITASEYELKAVFLHRFISFVEWPDESFESPESPYVIGVAGTDPFGTALADAVDGVRVGDRQIEVRSWEPASDAGDPQVLFVPQTERLPQSEWERLEVRPVLIVTETEDESAKGAINLYVENSLLRFEVRPGTVLRAGLRMSSRLLGLARIIDE